MPPTFFSSPSLGSSSTLAQAPDNLTNSTFAAAFGLAEADNLVFALAADLVPDAFALLPLALELEVTLSFTFAGASFSFCFSALFLTALLGYVGLSLLSNCFPLVLRDALLAPATQLSVSADFVTNVSSART